MTMESKVKNVAIAGCVVWFAFWLGVVFNSIPGVQFSAPTGVLPHIMLIISSGTAIVAGFGGKKILETMLVSQAIEEGRQEERAARRGIANKPASRLVTSMPVFIQMLSYIGTTAIFVTIAHSVAIIFSPFGWVWTFSLFTFVPELVASVIWIARALHLLEKRKVQKPPENPFSSGASLMPSLDPDDDENR